MMKYQTESFEEVKNSVSSALKDFISQDKQLLELIADERAATHRIACNLQKYFPEWHVDCEYNRRGRKPKCQSGRKVRPDIIIHHRGLRENLLCIEVKKYGESLDEDSQKLQYFTNPNKEYNYNYGLLLVLQLKEPYKITKKWFTNGKEIQDIPSE